MENPSFAEIKERFNKLNVLPYPKPLPPATTQTNNESTPIEVPVPDRPKLENSNQTYDTIDTTTISDPTGSPSQTSNENSFSSSREAIKARFLQRGVTNIPIVKKPPVPLPPSANQHQNEIPSSESSSSISDSLILKPILTSDVNTSIDIEKSTVSVPRTDENEEENIYAELSNDFSDSAISSNVSQDTNEYIGFNRPIAPLPNPIHIERHETPSSEPVSVSLDAMLPPKCMFLESEASINGYQRKNPQTIIYPRMKPSMPKMTTEEINILQRYLNT